MLHDTPLRCERCRNAASAAREDEHRVYILDDSVRPLVVVNVAEDGIRVRNPPVKVSDSHRRLLAAQAERSIVRMPGKRSGVPSARVTSRR